MNKIKYKKTEEKKNEENNNLFTLSHPEIHVHNFFSQIFNIYN